MTESVAYVAAFSEERNIGCRSGLAYHYICLTFFRFICSCIIGLVVHVLNSFLFLVPLSLTSFASFLFLSDISSLLHVSSLHPLILTPNVDIDRVMFVKHVETLYILLNSASSPTSRSSLVGTSIYTVFFFHLFHCYSFIDTPEVHWFLLFSIQPSIQLIS